MEITTEKIKKIEKIHYDGHLYNLTTKPILCFRQQKHVLRAKSQARPLICTPAFCRRCYILPRRWQ